MPARVTASHASRPRLRGLSRLVEGRAARREAVRGQRELARALAGDFGPGVQADVLAARDRSMAGDQLAA